MTSVNTAAMRRAKIPGHSCQALYSTLMSIISFAFLQGFHFLLILLHSPILSVQIKSLTLYVIALGNILSCKHSMPKMVSVIDIFYLFSSLII